jgi:UDP-glucose 4-epimerase
MTVLVTGGLGAIGSWVLRGLIDRGERPVVFDLRNDTSLVADITERFDLEIGDMLQPGELDRLAERYEIDRICHLAAVMPPAAQADPAFGFRVNADGTVAVLELARRLMPKRLVFTSSKGVYGNPRGRFAYPEYEPVSEDHPFQPDDVYGVTKLAGELMVRQFREVYELDTVVLRLASTYGPGKLERHGDVGIVSQIIEYAHAGRPVSVPRGGDERTDQVYNRDVGNAIVVAAFAEQPESRIYNIGTGEGPTLYQVAAAVRSLVPGAQIEIGPGVGRREGGRASGSVMDIRRVKAELGFVPQFPLAAGIRDYLNWLDQRATRIR